MKEEETRGYYSFIRGQAPAPRLPPVPATVALAELEPARKRALWQWMQANDLATAEYLAGLKSNPDVAELEAVFGPVRPVVSIDYLRGAIG